MTDAVIIAAGRSLIGRAHKGSLVTIRPDDLCEQVIAGVLAAVPQLDPHDIEDLLVGCSDPRDEQGGNIARRVAVQLGLDDVPGVTVSRFCASSLQSSRMARQAIASGDGDVFVSAGVEAVSRYRGGLRAEDSFNPRFSPARDRSERYARLGGVWQDPRDDGQLPDIYIAMGQTAEHVAGRWGITRRHQDEFAALSQQRAVAAQKAGFFGNEIVPVKLPCGTTVDRDDCPRDGTTAERLAQLRPVFRPGGTVTAGNACPLNDGAAAVVITSDRRARSLGLEPAGRIVASAVTALSPEIMGMGPVTATRAALAKAGMTTADIDLFEINEAFAAQVVACCQELDLGWEKVNVHGGAIALGHPFGMTGARLQTTLLNALRSADREIGLATMCVGGGQGMAMVIERLR